MNDKKAPLKKNPLKNLDTLLKLNPYVMTVRRMSLFTKEHSRKAKKKETRRGKEVHSQGVAAYPHSIQQFLVATNEFLGFVS
ncbi:hypothetical protein C1H46_012461 [Malus baccata]|uniref:Large ribosomal subunit protein uL4 C-terminal domain-containing protein n=1 Tax=Malus baccata TaxID=106549 RepID=A0A540MSR0_MALBA|nr:hypothetical protein C1H46_012461 [Malus baccata]